jgi:ParD-like antitoxin of type II ParDE toxin-antitoxin system
MKQLSVSEGVREQSLTAFPQRQKLPTDRTGTFSLTVKLNVFIRPQVAFSRYRNAIEEARSGLRFLQQREPLGNQTNVYSHGSE